VDRPLFRQSSDGPPLLSVDDKPSVAAVETCHSVVLNRCSRLTYMRSIIRA